MHFDPLSTPSTLSDSIVRQTNKRSSYLTCKSSLFRSLTWLQYLPDMGNIKYSRGKNGYIWGFGWILYVWGLICAMLLFNHTDFFELFAGSFGAQINSFSVGKLSVVAVQVSWYLRWQMLDCGGGVGERTVRSVSAFTPLVHVWEKKGAHACYSGFQLILKIQDSISCLLARSPHVVRGSLQSVLSGKVRHFLYHVSTTAIFRLARFP